MKLIFLFALTITSTLTSITDDLLDIVNLIHINEIEAIAEKYLLNDKEFKEVMKYLQGDEWAAIVQAVADNPTRQKLIDYLSNAGMPVYVIYEYINQFINDLKPLIVQNNNIKSVSDFLDEIRAIIPTNKLLILLNDKLINSPAFQELFAKVSNETAHKLVEDVRALPEFQRAAQKLTDMGFKVDETFNAIYELLGW